MGQQNAPVVNVFDLLQNTQYSLLEPSLQDIFKHRSLYALPAPYAPARRVDFPFKLDVITVPTSNGTTSILKHYMAMPGANIPADIAASLCVGTPHVLDLRGANPKVAVKALELLKDRLPGTQYRNLRLTSSALAQSAGDAPSAKDEGYDFIEQHCPIEGTEMDRVRWVARQLSDESSKLYGWNKLDVKEAISAIKTGSNTVNTIDYVPLTLMDMTPTMRSILKDIIPTLKSTSLVMVGRPGFGKTPCLQTLAMALSKYYIDSPCHKTKLAAPGFRTTESLDVVRTAPGMLERPDLFDDGDMNAQPATALKAFLDVSKQDGAGVCAMGRIQIHQAPVSSSWR